MSCEQLSVKTLRNLILDSVEYARHGHMGMPLGAATMAYALFRHHMKHNPSNPKWFNRDRFVLASGHGSILLYSLLHLSGYDITLSDLKDFRKLNSITPGHPEVYVTPGVDASTGPLGQGISLAVGMAIAEAHLAARFNIDEYNIVDNYTFVICGDGDLQEGVALEAATIAGNLGLGKLIVLYDSNDITSDGPLCLSSMDNIQMKFQAMNWQTLEVKNGNDFDMINEAIVKAKNEKNKPTLIEVKNIIGYGSTLQGTEKIHSNPVGAEEAEKIKHNLLWELDDFEVPKEVKEDFSHIKCAGEQAEEKWKKLLVVYQKEYPSLYKKYLEIVGNERRVSYDSLGTFVQDKIATRTASGEILNNLYAHYSILVGGSADLASSNKTTIKKHKFMSVNDYSAPNIHFGVREFAMAGIVNGINLYGGLHGYCGTFLVFSDYMRSAIRHAALMEVPTTFIMTHDSLLLGQDGPTHQPIEHLISLRAIPNLVVFRPADANETKVGWKLALESKRTPYVLALGRHDVPVLNGVDEQLAEKGGYILDKVSENPDLIIIATGSEVETALIIKERLSDYTINIVSLPSWELFDMQTDEYKESILPKSVTKKVSIELGSTIGWDRYVGAEGLKIGVDRFGKSGAASDILAEYELDVDSIVKKILNYMKK